MADEDVTVQLAREEVTISKREVEQSRVRVNVRVEEEEQLLAVALHDGEVSVERLPADEVVDELPETVDDGTTIVIPLVEEVVVLQKRYRIRERVRITRITRSREVEIPTTVRREVADVDRFSPET